MAGRRVAALARLALGRQGIVVHDPNVAEVVQLLTANPSMAPKVLQMTRDLQLQIEQAVHGLVATQPPAAVTPAPTEVVAG